MLARFCIYTASGLHCGVMVINVQSQSISLMKATSPWAIEGRDVPSKNHRFSTNEHFFPKNRSENDYRGTDLNLYKLKL